MEKTPATITIETPNPLHCVKPSKILFLLITVHRGYPCLFHGHSGHQPLGTVALSFSSS